MKDLLTPKERAKLLCRINKQKFSNTRKNVAPWCMQWISTFISITWLVLYLVDGTFELNQQLLFFITWFMIALLSHVSWKRYMEQSILNELLEKTSEPQGRLYGDPRTTLRAKPLTPKVTR